MVHSGGHEERRAAQRGRRERMPGPGRGAGRGWGQGPASVAVALTLVLGAALGRPPIAQAQAAIGFQGGFAIDPEQAFGGVFFQSGDLGRGIRVRPGIDGATGQGLRIATINADLVYGAPLGANGWTFIAGGGPSIVVTRIPELDFRDTAVGFHSLVGFGHDSGFFAEIRLGSGRAQQLKVGVGWAVVLN